MEGPLLCFLLWNIVKLPGGKFQNVQLANFLLSTLQVVFYRGGCLPNKFVHVSKLQSQAITKLSFWENIEETVKLVILLSIAKHMLRRVYN